MESHFLLPCLDLPKHWPKKDWVSAEPIYTRGSEIHIPVEEQLEDEIANMLLNYTFFMATYMANIYISNLS